MQQKIKKVRKRDGTNAPIPLQRNWGPQQQRLVPLKAGLVCAVAIILTLFKIYGHNQS